MFFKKFPKHLLILVVTYIFIGLNLNAQNTNQDLWTLEECIQLALKNNLTIQGSSLTVTDNEIQLNQSKADLYPSLNFGGGYTNLWGRSIDPTTNLFSNQRIQSFGLQGSARMTLYGGSRLRNTIKQNQTDLLASNYDLEKDKNDVMLNVTTAFLTVILNTELLENSKLQLNTTDAQLETTRKQVKAGALPYSNELDLMAQVESNKVQVINAENDLRISKLRLKQLLLIPSSEPFEIQIPELGEEDMISDLPEADNIYAVAEGILPEIKSVDLYVESAGYGVKIARGGLDPILSASADMYSNYSSAANRAQYTPTGDSISSTIPIGYAINPLDGSQIPVLTDVVRPEFDVTENYPVPNQIKDNWSQSLGITLQIPVFNGLSSRSMYQRSKIQKQSAELQAQQTRLQLRQSIELAYTDALAAKQTYEASVKQVASLEESFRATQKSYDLGARSYFDYQIASNNLFRARSDLLQSKYNFIFTLKVIDFYIGKPITLE